MKTDKTSDMKYDLTSCMTFYLTFDMKFDKEMSKIKIMFLFSLLARFDLIVLLAVLFWHFFNPGSYFCFFLQNIFIHI